MESLFPRPPKTSVLSVRFVVSWFHSPDDLVYLTGTGEKGKGIKGKPLHYEGSIFHRVIPQFMLCASFQCVFA